jgi:hypothetical protein
MYAVIIFLSRYTTLYCVVVAGAGRESNLDVVFLRKFISVSEAPVGKRKEDTQARLNRAVGRCVWHNALKVAFHVDIDWIIRAAQGNNVERAR